MDFDWTILRSGEQTIYRLRACMKSTVTAGSK